MRIVLLCLALALLCSHPAPARAQSQAQPSAQDKKQARAHFTLAEALKKRGDALADAGDSAAARTAYGKAADEYMQAFGYYEHPAFIYNVAQMRRLRGERSKAIDAYEMYLVLEPSGDRSDEVRGFITILRRELQEATPAPEPEPEPPTTTTTPVEPNPTAGTEGSPPAALESGVPPAQTSDPRTPATDPEAAAGTATEPLTTPPEAAASPPEASAMPPEVAPSETTDGPDPGASKRRTGIVLMIAGAAAFAVGAKYGLDARSLSDELTNPPPTAWETRHRDLYTQGEQAERNAFIGFGLGGAVFAAGVVLYTLGRNAAQDSADSGLSVAPALGRDSTSVVVSGHF
ncbi:hypothetical protein [Haliangium sp.]|uniref:hypothetical protein n=1 Tax=Haliangium sp. TaxID=2663208 RepID=UPI003D0E95A1